MRVLVVDDSAVARRVLTAIIESDPAMRVVDFARNGAEAVEKAKRLKPDLIIMDVEMPVLDGLSALRRIQVECEEPRPAVVICSALTRDGSAEALEAMRLGAADIITKTADRLAPGAPESKRREVAAQLRAIIEGRAHQHRLAAAPVTPARANVGSLDLRVERFDLVAIASSTGGPPVLEQILTALPPDLPVPVVVAQHMPQMFTRSLSHRLDNVCRVSVVHADEAMPLVPGTVSIIRGGAHGFVTRTAGGRLGVTVKTEGCEGYVYKPSADLLFDSAAQAVGGRCLAVVLTGMGDDGSRGAAALAAKGSTILTQSEATCVVYGMPRAVVIAGHSAAAMSPAELAEVMADLSPTGDERLTERLRRSA